MNVNGVKVISVGHGMQGEKLGIKPGDFIVSYAQIPIFSLSTLSNSAEYAKRNGMNKIDLIVLRENNLINYEASTNEKLGMDYVEEIILMNEKIMSTVPGFVEKYNKRSEYSSRSSVFYFSRFIVSSHGALTEIALWLGLILFAILGWNVDTNINDVKNGIVGAVAGLVLWFIITVFLVTPALMLEDIRKSVKKIEEEGK